MVLPGGDGRRRSPLGSLPGSPPTSHPRAQRRARHSQPVWRPHTDRGCCRLVPRRAACEDGGKPAGFLLLDASSRLSRGRAVRPATCSSPQAIPTVEVPSGDPALNLWEGSCDGPPSPARSTNRHRPTQAHGVSRIPIEARPQRGNPAARPTPTAAQPATSTPPAAATEQSSGSWVGVRSRRFAPSDRFGPDRPQSRVVLVKGGSPRHATRSIGTDGQPADWFTGRSPHLAPNRPPTLEPAPPSTIYPHVTRLRQRCHRPRLLTEVAC